MSYLYIEQYQILFLLLRIALSGSSSQEKAQVKVAVSFHFLQGGGVGKVNGFNKFAVELLEASLSAKTVNRSELSSEKTEEVLLLSSVTSVDKGGMVIIKSCVEL